VWPTQLPHDSNTIWKKCQIRN